MVDIEGLFESSRLLDWELDSIKTVRNETVAGSLINYRHLKTEIQSQCVSLSAQQERIDEEATTEPKLKVWIMRSWGALESIDGKTEDAEEYSRRKRELDKKIVMLKIQELCLKRVYVSSCIRKLQELAKEGSKIPTPVALQYSKFEEWSLANKQIYQLKSQILEQEAAKVRLHKEFFIREGKESSQSSIKTRQSFTSHLELKLGAKDCDPITGELNLEEVVVPKSTVQITSILDQILDTSYANNSFESCKLKTYIRECWDVQDIDDEFPTGVHPDRYQEFVGGLTQYIVDKQLLLQRESLTYDIVHSKLEQYLMPAIYSLIQDRISKPEEDSRLSQVYANLGHITQTQFGISPEFQDDDIAPYYAAVACMKTMTLSILPSRKIHAIVSAAQCVFRKLNELCLVDSAKPPGADEFMDVWVYVILKSRIPNLASTVAFLRRYSNPNLSFSEAGYYLASVEFACQFLRQLNEHDYRNKSPLLKHNIVVCEPRRFGKMMTDELPMFDMVLQDVWLPGYELFAVKEWHLDPTRLYRTVLVPSSNKTKQVKVAVIKLKTENLSLAHMELLEREFLCTGEKNGLLSRHTEHGMAVTLNVDHVTDPVTLVSIPDGKYDSYEELVTSFSTLDKLICDDTPSSRNSPVDVVEMENVIETLQKMNETVVVAYGLAESPTNAIQYLVKALVAALTQLGYLSSLFDTPEMYSELIQVALEKFQTHYNKNCGVGTTKLPNNGQLCPNTWEALKRSLEEGSVSE
ncbi:uncharacterized protein [Acropora muricata]|uniref:uncharacterized protein isoform X1 n=1 Tax=Acropora muricata TaxID=159855 RepID=UPI0034E4A2F5